LGLSPNLRPNLTFLDSAEVESLVCICSISALPDFNQSLAKFIQSRYSRLMLLLLCGSINLVVIRVMLWTILGSLPRRKEYRCFALGHFIFG